MPVALDPCALIAGSAQLSFGLYVRPALAVLIASSGQIKNSIGKNPIENIRCLETIRDARQQFCTFPLLLCTISFSLYREKPTYLTIIR